MLVPNTNTRARCTYYLLTYLLPVSRAKTARSRWHWSAPSAVACEVMRRRLLLAVGSSALLGCTSVGSALRSSSVRAAAWIAQPAAFQQAWGCVRADAGMLVAGWAAAEWAFGLACAAHPRRHVVARCGRGRTGWQRGRLNGQDARMPWWAVARWSWWERICDAGTMRGRWHGLVVAERGLIASLGGRSLVTWFYWFLAPIRFISPGRQAHRGWSSSWCGVARPSLPSVQVV